MRLYQPHDPNACVDVEFDTINKPLETTGFLGVSIYAMLVLIKNSTLVQHVFMRQLFINAPAK